jgi:hypothetical protein
MTYSNKESLKERNRSSMWKRACTACIPAYTGSRICCPKDIQQTFERGSTYGLGRGLSPTSLDLPPSLRKESASKSLPAHACGQDVDGLLHLASICAPQSDMRRNRLFLSLGHAFMQGLCINLGWQHPNTKFLLFYG